MGKIQLEFTLGNDKHPRLLHPGYLPLQSAAVDTKIIRESCGGKGDLRCFSLRRFVLDDLEITDEPALNGTLAENVYTLTEPDGVFRHDIQQILDHSGMTDTGVFTAFGYLAAVDKHDLAVRFADDLGAAPGEDIVSEESSEYAAFFNRFDDRPHAVYVISHNNDAAGNDYPQTVGTFFKLGNTASGFVFPEIGVEASGHPAAVVLVDAFE